MELKRKVTIAVLIGGILFVSYMLAHVVQHTATIDRMAISGTVHK